MLGPFYDRDGVRTTPERWASLVESTTYSEIATTDYPSLGVTVRTTWLGHDPKDHTPPRIFATRSSGEDYIPEGTTASLNDARHEHALTCARYTEQTIVLGQGGSNALREGTL